MRVSLTLADTGNADVAVEEGEVRLITNEDRISAESGILRSGGGRGELPCNVNYLLINDNEEKEGEKKKQKLKT